MPTAFTAALAVAVAVLGWALTFPLIKIALVELAPMPIAATRFSIATLLAMAWLIWRRQRLPSLADALRFLLSGLMGIALYNFGQNYGQQTVAAGAASFIVNTAPLITMILSVIFLRERFGLWGWLGTFIGLIGVALIGSGQPGGLSFGAGTSLIAGAALCSAVNALLLRPLIARYGVMDTMAYTVIGGTLLLTPWLPEGVTALSASSLETINAIVVLGVFSAAIGYAAWGYTIRHFGSAGATNFVYLIPPVAMLLAFVMTGEVPNALTLIGGSLAIAGVVIVNTTRRKPVVVSPSA